MKIFQTCDWRFSRRVYLVAAFSFAFTVRSQTTDPWPANRLIEPEELARILKGGGPKPTIISVVFPVLYRQRHIQGAIPAGPTSKPEGITALRKAVSGRSKDEQLVIYCGCCPMEHCPNIRPAYTELKNAGFRNVRVLHLATNLHTDWTAKGYPVESPA